MTQLLIDVATIHLTSIQLVGVQSCLASVGNAIDHNTERDAACGDPFILMPLALASSQVR